MTNHPQVTDVRRINQWIAEQETARDDGVALLDGFCNTLVDRGLPTFPGLGVAIPRPRCGRSTPVRP